jgi:hypothetical protein
MARGYQDSAIGWIGLPQERLELVEDGVLPVGSYSQGSRRPGASRCWQKHYTVEAKGVEPSTSALRERLRDRSKYQSSSIVLAILPRSEPVASRQKKT